MLLESVVQVAGEHLVYGLGEVDTKPHLVPVSVPRKDDVQPWVRVGQERGLLQAFVLDDFSSIHSAVKALR